MDCIFGRRYVVERDRKSGGLQYTAIGPHSSTRPLKSKDVQFLDMSRDGKAIATADSKGVISIERLDESGETKITRLGRMKEKHIRRISLSKSGGSLVAETVDSLTNAYPAGQVHDWRLDADARQPIVLTHQNPEATFSKDEGTLVVASRMCKPRDSQISIYDIGKLTPRRNIVVESEPRAVHISLANEGELSLPTGANLLFRLLFHIDEKIVGWAPEGKKMYVWQVSKNTSRVEPVSLTFEFEINAVRHTNWHNRTTNRSHLSARVHWGYTEMGVRDLQVEFRDVRSERVDVSREQPRRWEG